MPEVKEKKENKILSIFAKEYKYEGIILLVLAIIAVVLGVLVVTGSLIIDPSVYIIGTYPNAFAWILIILGGLSFLLAVWPFYKPSVYEIKRVSWPSRGEILRDATIVFAFIIVLALFFLIIDIGFTYLIQGIEWLASKMQLWFM